MSRIGNSPVTIPNGVTVELKGTTVNVKGPKGELTRDMPEAIVYQLDGDQMTFTRNSDDKKTRGLHGLSRALVNNMVQGVNKGFSKKLIVEGVGFKVSLAGSTVKLSLGFSHDVNYQLPEGITAKVDQNNITIEGIDKQLVGQVAAEIRKLRKPEPYKGKGIRYDGEYIIRKEGKKAGGE